MSREPEQSDGRREGMLRRPGADEAPQTTQAPPAPIGHIKRGPTVRSPSWWLRWGPPAAAAAMLIAATILTFRPGDGEADARKQLAIATAKVRELQAALDEARDGLKQARAALGEAQAVKERSARKAGAELARLRKRMESLKSHFKASAEQQVALQRLIAEKDADVAAMRKGLAAAQAALALATRREKDSAAELARLGRKLAALAGEMTHLREMHDKAEASGREARRELARLRARNSAMLLAMRQAYLLVPPDRPVGLKERQAAAQRTKMIARCADLRRAASDEATARLLDRLEVMLTRLALLDPHDADATRTFEDLFGSSGLETQIDEALRVGLAPPAVRTWLFEAKLILTGEGGVG